VLGLLLVVAAISVGGTPALPQAPTVPASVDLVRIDVAVLDSKGEPVRGLTAADFAVEEDGMRHPVVSFEAVVASGPREAATGLREDSTANPARVSVPRTREPSDGRSMLILVDDIHLSPPRVGTEWPRSV
jgi:hypothetical protein